MKLGTFEVELFELFVNGAAMMNFFRYATLMAKCFKFITAVLWYGGWHI